MAKITMTIAGREFNLLTLYYQFQQDVDWKGRPESPHRNGLLLMAIESTDDTYLFKQFLTEELNTIPFSGKIESFLYRDEAAVRSLQWKEAYIIKMREMMEAYTNQPMITELILSPIDLVIDYSTYLTRHRDKTGGWWKLDPSPGIVPMQSPVYQKTERVIAEAEEELDTEVSVIELTDPLEEDSYSAPGIYLQKNYRFKVLSYTKREPKPSEQIHWRWGYSSESKEGQTVYKELESQINGDTIHI